MQVLIALHCPYNAATPVLDTLSRLLLLPYAVLAALPIQDSLQRPAGTTSCLLQLAMNCSSHHTASTCAAAACRLAIAMKPSEARKLLVTAAARQHVRAVSKLAASSGCVQHMNAQTVETVLQELLAVALTQRTCGHGQGDEVLAVLNLPAAAELDEAAISRLHTALCRTVRCNGCRIRRGARVGALLHLPNAQQLRREHTRCTRARARQQ